MFHKPIWADVVKRSYYPAFEQAEKTFKGVHLGLAYDHRLLNGREAALFLRAVKAGVEAPARLESGGDAAVQS